MENIEIKPINRESLNDSFSPMIISTPDFESEMKNFTIDDKESINPANVSDTKQTAQNSIDNTASNFDTDISMQSANKSNKETAEDAPMLSSMSCDDTAIAGPSNYSKIEYFCDRQVVELSRCTWRGSTNNQRFLKGCLWSPDGTCILTIANGNGMHIFEMPNDLYSVDSIADDRPLDILQSAVHIKEGGSIYDYCWYPFMNSNNPTSCCWLATRQHEPIQMWDAYHGDLRCSYRGYNAVDEIESALSVLFSSDGQEVIGGYKKSIKIFRTDIPGRDCYAVPIKSPSSALACSLVHNILAVGSWSTTISLFDKRDPFQGEVCQMNDHRGGITYIRFLEQRNILISGARKDNDLLLWDLRNTQAPLGKLFRHVDTNQRVYFDVSYDEKWIISGDTSGIIHAWNLNAPTIEDQTFTVHYDCCNGVSMHPSKPMIATSSGQHHFELDDISKINNNGFDDSDGTVIRKKPRENSLIIWWCGKMSTNT